jgi:hypothetical protein
MYQREIFEGSVKKFRDPLRRELATVVVIMATAETAEILVIVIGSKKLMSSWVV